MNEADTQSPHQTPTTAAAPSAGALLRDGLVAVWLLVVGLGYAATLFSDRAEPLFSVDLLIPAYAVMVALVLFLCLRPKRSEEAQTKRRRGGREGGAHGG